MAKTLVTKFKSVPAEKTIKGILVGLKYVLEASVAMGNEIKEEQSSSEIKDWIDDSNEARNKDHQVKVTAKCPHTAVLFLLEVSFSHHLFMF